MMKGKISASGHLSIYRGSDYKFQECRESATGDTMQLEYDYCGDACPRFGEPEKEVERYVQVDTYCERHRVSETGKTLLHICQGRILTFDEFEDER